MDTRQLTLQLRAPGAPASSYCEMFDTSVPGDFTMAMTWTTDGSNFQQLDFETAQGPLATTEFTLTLQRSPPDLRCTVPWRDGTHVLAGAIPPGITPGEIALVIGRLYVALDYLIVIRTEGT